VTTLQIIAAAVLVGFVALLIWAVITYVKDVMGL
jgi:hypothetical protein